MQQRIRIQPLLFGQGLHAVELADQRDEPGRQLLSPPVGFGQGLQRVIEVTPAMCPTPDLHELVRQGDLVVDLVAVGHQHAALARTDVQKLRRLCAA